MPSQKALKGLVGGAGLAFIGIVVSFIIGFFNRMIAARYLGPTDYGMYTLALTILFLCTTLALLGLTRGVQRFVSVYRGQGNDKRIKASLTTCLTLPIVPLIVVSLVLFQFVGWLAKDVFENPAMEPLLRTVVLILPFFAYFRLIKETFLAYKKVDYSMWLEAVLQKVLILIAVITVWYLHRDVKYLLELHIGVYAACVVFGLWLLNSKITKFKSLKIPTFDMYSKLLVFSIPLLLAEIMGMIVGWSDSILIGMYLPEEELGYYNVAFTLASTLSIFLRSFGTIFYPIAGELYGKGNTLEIGRLYGQVQRWTFLCMFPFFLMILLFSRDIINVLFGQNYMAGGTALVILSIGYFIHDVSGPSTRTLEVFHRTKILMILSVVFACINIVLNIILIQRIGINGAAISSMIVFAVHAVVLLLIVRQEIRIVTHMSIYIKYIVSGVVAYGVVWILLQLDTSLAIHFMAVLCAIIMLSIYAGLLLLFKAVLREDIMVLGVLETKIGISLAKVRTFLERFVVSK